MSYDEVLDQCKLLCNKGCDVHDNLTAASPAHLLQSKELRTQNEQLQTVNTSLGSEVNKLQKQLELLRSQQEDGGQVRSLEEELEHLRKELEEAHAQRNKMEEEHINEKMDLTQVGEGDRHSTRPVRLFRGFAAVKVLVLHRTNTHIKYCNESQII